MRTSHALILAAAILGAAWILKPVPVEQVSQAELQSREELQRWAPEQMRGMDTERARQCAASIGKTLETLNRKDPAQEAPYRKCMQPEEPRGRLQRFWDKLWALLW